MGPEAENLLETDRIEDVLEADASPPPVMVVQKGNRALPWLLIVASLLLLALGSAYAYHRREVARLRREAELAQRDYQREIERERAEEAERRLKSVPPPADPPVVVTTSPPTSSPTTTPAVAVAPGAGASTAAAGSSPSPPSTNPAPPETPASPPRPKVLNRLVDKANPAPGPDPAPAGPKVGPGADAEPAVAAGSGLEEASPFDELNGGGGPGRAEAAPPAAAPAVALARPRPAAPPADPPLPSREETERLIRAEAAAIQQQNNQRLEQQNEELHVLRDDERRRFLDELRMTLEVHGRRAGPEIERLSNTSGRTEDPKVLGAARYIILGTRFPQRVKVRRLREMQVPEAVILDYLANELNHNLGARNGPRTRNDVWIKAGELLVKYYDQDARRSAARPAAGAPARPH